MQRDVGLLSLRALRCRLGMFASLACGFAWLLLLLLLFLLVLQQQLHLLVVAACVFALACAREAGAAAAARRRRFQPRRRVVARCVSSGGCSSQRAQPWPAGAPLVSATQCDPCRSGLQARKKEGGEEGAEEEAPASRSGDDKQRTKAGGAGPCVQKKAE